jgi:hypothetical protein
MAKRIVFQRTDCKWGWKLVGDNDSDVIATDGSQGYENEADARAMADKVISGHYVEAERRRSPRAECDK